MPTRYKDYPIYTYDEPAVYSDFTGGINSDPSNEHLLTNELRDCVNMHYLSGALVKRKGGKKLCNISCDEDLNTIQGIFLFTYKITYIIIAADGKLFQGVFNEDTTIKLNRLYIKKSITNHSYMFDPEDCFTGIPEKQPSELIGNTKHDGYIQTVFVNRNTQETYIKNERGSYYDIASGAIQIGDVFTETIGLMERQFLCIKDFEKTYEYPDELHNWELNYGDVLTDDGESFHYINDNDEEVTVNASDITSTADIAALERYGVYLFKIERLSQWTTRNFCYWQGKFYHCKNPHYNRYGSISDQTLFRDVSNIYQTVFDEQTYLIFQNYKKVEAATLNNKLYIATGTRLIEVYIVEGELRASPISPYLCNYTEITKIGYNYMSPYPELAVASQDNTVTTSISAIKVLKTVGNRYLLQPVMNIQIGDSIDNYYFRWEKYVNGNWYVIIPFYAQKNSNLSERYSSIEVDDANQYSYRVTFAKSFELEGEIVEEFDATKSYNINDYVSNGAHVYKCLQSYDADDMYYPSGEFSLSPNQIIVVEGENSVQLGDKVTVWKEVFDYKVYPYLYETTEENEERVVHYGTVTDYIVNEVDGEYFGSATSVLFNDDLGISDQYNLIQSCTKILADGQKLLLYGDRYNSGQWFKTIIDNPGYITDRGCLSFKTNKNEELIKVIPFQGNLIAFANSDNVGGSIHLIQGNGDDYNDETGYYSPYQRKTINASVSCDNADTVQICNNYLIFKYFNRLYYINASDLSNDVVKVTQCNDRVITNNQEVAIPWDDNDCISEVTDTYYALIWKEKYYQDDNGELVLEHPGIRAKLYYKMSVKYDDENYGMPWLRDESDLFNSRFIIYIKGQPVYLYHNTLISFSKEYYKDIEESYECKVHFRGEGLNYPQMYKLIEHIMIGFHRNQYNKVDLDVIIRNEAGHILLDSTSKLKSIGDLAALNIGKKLNSNPLRLDSTIQDTKLLNTINMFPCLLADTTVYAKTDESFTLSSVTYNYTSIDSPDQNPYDTYANIIRPKEVK